MRQHVQTKREEFNIIQHARKLLLYNKKIQWQKKNTNLFDVVIGAYDGAEVCEIAGLLLWNNLANKFDKNSVGFYRDDGLSLLKNISGHRVDKIGKELYGNGLSLEIECNLKTVHDLDITSYLNNHIHFLSTENPITLQTFSNSYLYQSKLDYLTFPVILKFSMKHLNTIKISSIRLGMTTNINTNHQVTKMQWKLKKKHLVQPALQKTSPTTWANISFF